MSHHFRIHDSCYQSSLVEGIGGIYNDVVAEQISEPQLSVSYVSFTWKA